MSDRDKQLETIISNFSRYIAFKIRECKLYRYGIDNNDISQEIYLKLWKALENGNNIKHLPAYIRKIINSVIVNQLNQTKKLDKSIESQKIIFQMNHKTPKCVYTDKRVDPLLKLIEKFKKSKKQVLKLFLLDYKIIEISKLNGWSKGKTYNIFYRAMRDLRRSLEEEGIFNED